MDSLDENIFDKIKEIFGNFNDNLNILEEQIDVELQMDYFEFSKKQKDKFDPDDVIENRNNLFMEDASIYEKKVLMTQLATIERVEAYRELETYATNPDAELREWSILALQESRMVLETNLLDENQIFISTGLGGKGLKLRYFLVLLYDGGLKIDKWHRDIIKKEFGYIFSHFNSEVEEVKHYKYYSTLSVLIPLNIPLNNVINKAIQECNQFGNFLKSDFIITNVRKLNAKEIKNHLKEKDG